MIGDDRTALLIGRSGAEKLKNSSVAVFGIGGVGGFAAEALIRSGIGSLTVFDADVVDETNLNRQIVATRENVNKDKVSVLEARAKEVNPDINFTGVKVFYLPENADEYDLTKFDYIIDAVDTVTAKLELAERAFKAGVPEISCMGTGAKTDISQLKVGDINSTSVCPLARVMRRELKKRNVPRLKVVYSTEEPVKSSSLAVEDGGKKAPVPSMIFVPAAAGLLLAQTVVQDLLMEKNKSIT